MAWNRPKPGTDVPMPADIVHQALRGEHAAGYCDDCGGCLCHECGCDLDLEDDRGAGRDLEEVAEDQSIDCNTQRCLTCSYYVACSTLGEKPKEVVATVSQFEPLRVIERWLDSHHLAGDVRATLVASSYNGGANAAIVVGTDKVPHSSGECITIEEALTKLAESIDFWCGY